MRAVIYSRVSTDAQERDGTSLDTQERAGVEFVRQHPYWSLLESIRDTASGYTLDRPGMARVRQLLRSRMADVVVSYAVDRLSRNQIKLAVLLDEAELADARLEFVTETLEDSAIGRLMLSVRAFAAELEREKIVERTTRGKLERARSGRIPQAMGRGTYGYVYDPRTGKREIEPYQAEIVRRIFQRYAETRSFTRVSNELNDAGIPAFGGGRWHPLTIRRMLTNESYAGRLYYGKTRWAATRNGKTGQRRRRPTARPADEWLEITGSSPQIIEEPLWQRIQAILNDPERIARSPKPRYSYPLRGRLKCGLCGSAMVGQTMNGRNHLYHYYVCRVAFDRRQGKACSAQNVRADKLETGVWDEVRAVLTDPHVVLQELEHQRTALVDTDEIERLEHQIASIAEREKRLVRLYTFGEVDEGTIRNEAAALKQQRLVLEDRLRVARGPTQSGFGNVDPDMLAKACAMVADWLDRAEESARGLALEALQVAIQATPAAAVVTGVLPTDPNCHLPVNNHADARCKVKNSGTSTGMTPLTVAASLVATIAICSASSACCRS